MGTCGEESGRGVGVNRLIYGPPHELRKGKDLGIRLSSPVVQELRMMSENFNRRKVRQ